jgi:hypothetical protein
MSHLTMEQLLALREPGLEPGVHQWQRHVESCPHCRAELERLDQRVARLRALPALRPGRDRFAQIRARAVAERRGRRWRRAAVGGLAVAASLTLAGGALRAAARTLVAGETEHERVKSRSRQLERAVASFDEDRGVLDGRTASITASLEGQLARLDRQLEVVELFEPAVRQREVLRMWRERVGLLDALVDVHLTRARYVGF